MKFLCFRLVGSKTCVHLYIIAHKRMEYIQRNVYRLNMCTKAQFCYISAVQLGFLRFFFLVCLFVLITNVFISFIFCLWKLENFLLTADFCPCSFYGLIACLTIFFSYGGPTKLLKWNIYMLKIIGFAWCCWNIFTVKCMIEPDCCNVGITHFWSPVGRLRTYFSIDNISSGNSVHCWSLCFFLFSSYDLFVAHFFLHSPFSFLFVQQLFLCLVLWHVICPFFFL